MSFLLTLKPGLSPGSLTVISLASQALLIDSTGRGILPSMQEMLHWLCIVEQRENISRLSEFIDVTRNAFNELQRHQNLSTNFLNTPDLHTSSSQLKNLFHRFDANLSAKSINDLKVGYAIGYLYAIKNGHEIPVNFADCWEKIAKSPRSNRGAATDWRVLAEKFPTSSQAIQEIGQKIVSAVAKNFLSELRKIIAVEIPNIGNLPALNPLVADETGIEILRKTIEGISDSDALSNEFAINEGEEEQEEEDENNADLKNNESYIFWQWNRANNSSKIDATGIKISWESLTTEESRFHIQRFVWVLKSNKNEINFALTALLSFFSGLPYKLVIKLPLECNNDKWIDINSGTICWDRRQLVDQSKLDRSKIEHGYYPSQIIRVPLPSLMVDALRQFLKNEPKACSVGQLLFNSENLMQVERFYKAFLHGDKQFSHKCTPGRISRGFGNLILEICGSDTLAAILSGAFELCAPSQIDYLCIHEIKIYQILKEVYEYLGCGAPEMIDDLTYVGSPKRPTVNSVKIFFKGLRLAYQNALDSISNRSQIDDVLIAFNRMSELILAAIIFSLSHRGTRTKNLTLATLGVSEFAIVNDKASNEYSSSRVVAIPELAASLIQTHLGNIKSIATRIENIDRALYRKLLACTNGESPNEPLFFHISKAKKSWSLKPIWGRLIKNIFQENLDVDVNFGRHFWMSELVERGCDRFLIRVLMGHARRGAEPFGSVGALSPLESVAMLKKEMDAVILDLEIEPWRSLRQITLTETIGWKLPAFVPALNVLQLSNYVSVIDGKRKKFDVTNELCPFDNLSIVGFSYIEILQKKLVSGSVRPTAWAEVALSFLIFENVSSAEELQCMLAASSTGVRKFGLSLWLEYARPNCATVRVPLQVPTLLFIGKAKLSSFPSLEIIKAEVAGWLAQVDPRNFKGMHPEKSLDILFSCVQRYNLLVLPPYLNTASNVFFDAACISASSLGRIVNKNKISFDEAYPRITHRIQKCQTNAKEQIDSFFKTLREFSNSEKRHGEERARRTKALGALTEMASKSVELYPMCEDIFSWIRFELGAAANSPKRLLEVTTVLNYAVTLAPYFLDKSEDSVEDFEIEDWMDIKNKITSNLHVEIRDQNLSKLRRFCSYLIMSGLNIPRLIFIESDEKFDISNQVNRSASHYFTKFEIQNAIDILRQRLSDRPWIADQAQAKFELMGVAPLRSGEVNRLHSSHVTSDLPVVCITSSGFSHLKSKAARRLIDVDSKLHQQLCSISSTQSKISKNKNGGYLFLDAETESFHAAKLMDKVFIDVLKQASGEDGARLHSLRGSAITRAIVPEIESIIKAIYDGKIDAPHLNNNLRKWNHISDVARLSGHGHPMTTLRYYFSTWNVMRHYIMSRRFLSLRISLKNIGCEKIISESALRQKISRVKKINKNSEISACKIIQYAVASKFNCVEELCKIDAAAGHAAIVITPGSNSNNNIENAQQKLSYLLHRHETNRMSAAQKFDLGIEEAKKLDHNWHIEWPDIFDYSDSSEPYKKGAKIEKYLALETSKKIIQNVSQCTNIAYLLSYLSVIHEMPPNEILSIDLAFLDRIKHMRDLLTAELTLKITCNRKSNDNIAYFVKAIDTDIVMKKSYKQTSRQYEIHVVSRSHSKLAPKWIGVYSRIFKQACMAQYVILKCKQEKGFSHA